MRSKNKLTLSEEQLEIMRIEIGEILGRLKEKNVYDLREKIPVILINRNSIDAVFKKTEILKVKNFVTVVNQSFGGFSYLTRNPNFFSNIVEVEGTDHVTGVIDYRKTALLRQQTNSDNTNRIVCKEIQRSYDTIENRLLVIILFSIMIYCDKYLSLDSLVLTKERFDPTLEELKSIRERVASLLSSKRIKEILSRTTISPTEIGNLFSLMLRRIQLGKTPPYFITTFNLFCKLKDYIHASQDDVEVSRHVLEYYLLNITNLNDLFECWVFCKLLDAIINIYKSLRFEESHSSKGVMTLNSEDGSVKIAYQPSYDTEWKWKDGYLQDNPDIAIEVENGLSIIVDAKNQKYHTSDSHPNRPQMDSYIRSTNAKYGVFIHSESENPELWEKLPKKINNQEIVWTCLIPGHSSDRSNEANLQKIIDLMRSRN